MQACLCRIMIIMKGRRYKCSERSDAFADSQDWSQPVSMGSERHSNSEWGCGFNGFSDCVSMALVLCCWLVWSTTAFFASPSFPTPPYPEPHFFFVFFFGW